MFYLAFCNLCCFLSVTFQRIHSLVEFTISLRPCQWVAKDFSPDDRSNVALERRSQRVNVVAEQQRQLRHVVGIGRSTTRQLSTADTNLDDSPEEL